MYNIINKEISFIKEIQSNHFNLNHFKNKYYDNNTVDSNRNIKKKLGGKRL